MNHDLLLPSRVSPDMYSVILTTGWRSPGGHRSKTGGLACCHGARVGRLAPTAPLWHRRAQLRSFISSWPPDPGPAFGLLRRRFQRHRYRPASQFGESVTDAAQHPLCNRISAVKPLFLLCLMSQVDPQRTLSLRRGNWPSCPFSGHSLRATRSPQAGHRDEAGYPCGQPQTTRTSRGAAPRPRRSRRPVC